MPTTRKNHWKKRIVKIFTLLVEVSWVRMERVVSRSFCQGKEAEDKFFFIVFIGFYCFFLTNQILLKWKSKLLQCLNLWHHETVKRQKDSKMYKIVIFSKFLCDRHLENSQLDHATRSTRTLENSISNENNLTIRFFQSYVDWSTMTDIYGAITGRNRTNRFEIPRI